MGVGISIASRDTDIGTIRAAQITGSKEFSIGEHSRIIISFGMGLNTDTHYKSRMSKFRKLEITEFSYAHNNTSMATGFMTVLGSYFAGAGMNAHLGKGLIKEYTGIDWRFGRFIHIDDQRFIRLLIIGRKYRYPYYRADKNEIQTKFSKNIINLSLQAKICEKIHIGAEYRFDEEWGVVIKRTFFEDLLLGYEYDLRIGNGINKQNAHQFTLSYSY